MIRYLFHNSARSLLRASCIVLLMGVLAGLCAVAPTERANSAASASTQTPGDSASRPLRTSVATPDAVPDRVSYRFLFRHLIILSEQAAENEMEGGISELLPEFQAETGLGDEDFRLLLDVAFECERDVNAKDAQARAIIAQFRARYPAGRLPRGQAVPAPPVELRVLQTARDAIIERARDRFARALGAEEFGRFDTFVRTRFAPRSEATITVQ